MRVLITVNGNPPGRFLVKLYTEELIKEFNDLVNTRKRSEAIQLSLSKGRLEGEILEDEAPHVEADLLLSEDSARWDLVK